MQRRRIVVSFGRRIVESLESRVYLCGGDKHTADYGTFLAVGDPVPAPSISADAVVASPAVASAVPAYSSLPGAADTLFLDFDGYTEPSYGSYGQIVTPEMNFDGVAGFNDTELTAIQNVWKEVSEDYAPFNINVTTVEPPSFANGVAQRVVIGGDGAWTGGNYGGWSYIGNYTNSIDNVSFVFPLHLSKNAKYIGDAVSHESGHGFGLNHQSEWSGTTLVNEYYKGPGNGTAPIMGNSYAATRSLWWKGPSNLSSTSIQDDMAVISSATNTFGYKADDFGDSAANAFTLTPTGNTIGTDGLITKTSDRDYFRFDAAAGSVTLNVTVPKFANLDAKLELWSSDGLTLLASSDPTTGLGATITTTLAGGSYIMVVASHGSYGDVGTYTVSGTIVANPNAVVAPTAFSATAVGTNVNLTWADNASNETAYIVERSTSSAFTNVTAFNLGANTISMSDAGLAADTTYYYRVKAANATDASGYAFSNAATIPLAVTASAVAASSSQINVSWTNDNTETGFRVERSLDQQSWTTIASPAADVLSFADTGRSASTTYYYRVTALNAAGQATSLTASATTQALPAAPQAPTGLTYTALTRTSASLKWIDNATNETGYVVQRSTNGGSSWTTVATLGVDATTYTSTGLQKRKTYSFRVYATGVGGISGYSNTLTFTTPNAGPVAASSVPDLTDLKKKKLTVLS